MTKSDYADLNQRNYQRNADAHNLIGINSTLYLAYRDIPSLLEKFFFNKPKNIPYKILDYGCGAGLSTELISKMIINAGYTLEVFGIDINEENLKHARSRIPNGKFEKINQADKLEYLDQFDLIICNFVLVEHPFDSMVSLLKNIYQKLKNDGILLITNPSTKIYDKQYEWYSVNNNFTENEKMDTSNKRFKEDQPVKIQVVHPPDLTFTFFDYFHSEIAYRKAYTLVRFQLLITHKPLGIEEDKIIWKSEKKHSPHLIHVLKKFNSSQEK